MCNIYLLRKGEVQIGCDNKQDVYKASEQSLKISSNIKYVDWLRAIWVARFKIQMIITLSMSMDICIIMTY